MVDFDTKVRCNDVGITEGKALNDAALKLGENKNLLLCSLISGPMGIKWLISSQKRPRVAPSALTLGH